MLLDTHMWIWFATEDPNLSPTIAERMAREAGDAAISAVSIWEVMLLMHRGRLKSALPPEATVREWMQRNPLRIVPVDHEIAMLSRTLEFGYEDPADRFIAATAFHMNIPLATADARLRALPWLQTIG